MTIEYTSNRLVRLDTDHFIHILQDDERQKPNAGVGVPIEDLWTSAILQGSRIRWIPVDRLHQCLVVSDR